MKFYLIALIAALIIPTGLYAQQEEEGEQRLTVDTPVSLDFEKEAEETEAPKKKKPKKKVFYGLKTKKGFTRKGFGDKVTYELFYYLKKSELPKTFARDIYWYDFRQKAIRKTTAKAFDPKIGVLLHGPYEQRQGQITLKKGIYYKGTKHGRWMEYNRDSVLTNKEKYYQGWPRESLVSYYDPNDRKKMKELTPIEFGEKEGFYFLFHENGQLAVQGEYHWDEKIGDWTEFYSTGKRKKIVSYPKEAFDKVVKPYVKVEWNDKGKEVYRNTKMAKN